jgi:hypothetical protein
MPENQFDQKWWEWWVIEQSNKIDEYF